MIAACVQCDRKVIPALYCRCRFWDMIYPFFLVHMLFFGLSGFYMAYASDGHRLVQSSVG